MKSQMIDMAGISIEMIRKPIRNMHLSVKPPEGRVVLSIPRGVPLGMAAAFAADNIAWIRRQQARIAARPKPVAHRYVSGETLSIWGRPYSLDFRPDGRKNSFVLQGDRAILSMRAESSTALRAAYVREQYRRLLEEKVEELLPRWEAVTGLHPLEWRTKYMTTRWGTCVPVRGRIWLNVKLAEQPERCLEMVILHELLHFLVRNHGKRFQALMDRYMPDWREVEKVLNGMAG